MFRKLSRRENSSVKESENSQMDCNEENHYVVMVIRYIFAINRLKTTIHGEQIKKICLSSSPYTYSTIIGKVKKILIEKFGYELLDLGALKYILVNRINNPHLGPSSPQETADRILLFLTLTYIFMSCDDDESIVKEDDLWNFFIGLKIIKDNNFQHNYFGDIKKLITSKFVDQLYLSRRKIDGSEEMSYTWGPRANAEITRRSILEFVSKIYDNRSIESWPTHFAAVTNWENIESQKGSQKK